MRYFCDGAVLGSREFVNGVFEHERHHVGPKRKTGVRAMLYSATTQMLSEWLLNSGAYMHWMPAKPVW